MTQKMSILVSVFSDLETKLLERYIDNAISFAILMSADIHFLMPKNSKNYLVLALNRFPKHQLHLIRIVSHDVPEEYSFETVSDAIERYSCELILVPAGSFSEEDGQSARIRRDILEHSVTPIMLLSPTVNFMDVPIRSLLVPMSGEIRASSALKFGLQFASQIHVPVDLVHSASGDILEKSPLNPRGDQPHHEYRQHLDRILAEACPFSSTAARAQVRSLSQVEGHPSVEILKLAKNAPSYALVIEWHGSLIHGKAETLKNLLHQIHTSIILVRAENEQRSTLKIGPERQAA